MVFEEQDGLSQQEKEKIETRKRVIDYIYNDLKKRLFESVLADIVMDPVAYKEKCLSKKD